MYLDIFQYPEEMTGKQLEAEFKAVNSTRFDSLIADDDISFEMKQELLEHKHEVIQEMNYRKGESMFYPLAAFGFFDF